MSISHGARSVSDYARDVLFCQSQTNGADKENQLLQARVEQLASELESMNGEVDLLRRLVVEPPRL